MEVVHRIGKKTAVVVTKDDIRKQWVDAGKKILGLEDKDVGYIQGDRHDVAGKKLVICSLQSVWKPDRYPDWVFKDFGLVIFDEVHRMAADKFSRAVWNFPAKLRLGLSATVERSDGKDPAFVWNIGPIRVTTDMLVLTPKVLVGHFRHPGLGAIKMVPGRTAIGTRILQKSNVRNNAISQWVKSSFDKGRRIIIFSETKKHLEILYDSLINRQIPESQLAYYVGGMTDKQREVAKAKKVLLATYAMTAEATDIPWLDTAVLCTPRSDVRQVVGRILREHAEKKPPVVFDIVDGPSSVYLGYFRSRKKWYASIGAEVKTLKE
jgi:superfamily II DNA or RNA helicase